MAAQPPYGQQIRDPGRLPPENMTRLQHLRSTNTFSSNLSPEDALIVRTAGFRPLSLVFGVSVDHIGLQYGRWKVNMELPAPTQWLYDARHRAITRMVSEAALLDADGIIDVSVVIRRFEGEANVIELRIVGTAVKAVPDAAELWGITDWRHHGAPFTSDLSAKQFYLLLQSGYAPMSLVLGNSVYHVAHRGAFQAMGQAGRFMEIEQFTEALYAARNFAMSRMLAEANRLGAVGIYTEGDVMQHDHGWGHSTEFLAFGTAVRALPDTFIPSRPTLTMNVGS
jgi:uncharacterized protein YbjQ (UPF0145 family)